MTRESTGTSTALHSETALRFDWTKSEVQSIYRTPLPDLLFRAQTIHRQFHPPDRVQTCQLISIKTGGCPEDCAYCPQSAHYDADVERQGLLDPAHVISVASDAASRGVTRFCMGAAWREAPNGREFDKVLEMVRGIATARILMPASRVRLAAGRKQLSPEAVTLCFLAGANSIFVGEKLLTTPNPGADEDELLLQSLGMKPLEPHAV